MNSNSNNHNLEARVAYPVDESNYNATRGHHFPTFHEITNA